jgi:hypothetical protein
MCAADRVIRPGRPLATDSPAGQSMTDFTNTMSLRGFPPWRVITHKEMKRCLQII